MPDPLVIAGAGPAGAAAAQTLRAEGHDGPIVLIGAEPDAPYRRPPLSKDVLRGDTAPERTLLRPAGFWRDQDIELRTGVTVTGLDVADRRITLDDRSDLAYEKLLIATGGSPRSLPGELHSPGARTLRTLRDAAALRDDLALRPRLLVIGAGLIGLEVAATARALGCEVTVLEAAGVPLNRVAPPWLGGIYASLHGDHGTALHFGVSLRGLATGSGAVATSADGRSWEGDLAVVAIGMAPETRVAARAGIRLAGDGTGGIVVDEFCRTSAPHVFAAGDVAEQPHPLLGGHYRVEHWNNAQDQGAAAARNMLGLAASYSPEPWCWTEQYGVRAQICGWPAAADPLGERGVTVRGDTDARDFTAVFWRADRIVGAVSMNRPAEFRAVRRILATAPYADFDRLSDPATDLAQLVPTGS